MDDEIIVGWKEIHRKLYSHRSFDTLMKLGPESGPAGVVLADSIGIPPQRHKVVWCYSSMFRAYMTLRGQKKEQLRRDKKAS